MFCCVLPNNSKLNNHIYHSSVLKTDMNVYGCQMKIALVWNNKIRQTAKKIITSYLETIPVWLRPGFGKLGGGGALLTGCFLAKNKDVNRFTKSV